MRVEALAAPLEADVAALLVLGLGSVTVVEVGGGALAAANAFRADTSMTDPAMGFEAAGFAPFDVRGDDGALLLLEGCRVSLKVDGMPHVLSK